MTQSRQPMAGGSVQPGRQTGRDAFAQGHAGDPGAAAMSWDPAAGPDPRRVPWTKAIQEKADRI
ncbi:hypothetical protein ACFTWD_14525 [Streptomyces sp. NPDC056943]|uniref:hypothetical protein n=1 Tax=Streptomyces sp. NPDC056943 TaxID=3345971 RepID=UPI00362C8DFF